MYMYIYILYAMGCPTIFIQSHDDCRHRGEDASTNGAWQRPAARSGWIWRNPWRCGYELPCWTLSGDGNCARIRKSRSRHQIPWVNWSCYGKWIIYRWGISSNWSLENSGICSRKSLADAGSGFHRRYKKEKVLQIHWVSRFVVSFGAGYSLWFFNGLRTGKLQFYLISKPSFLIMFKWSIFHSYVKEPGVYVYIYSWEY